MLACSPSAALVLDWLKTLPHITSNFVHLFIPFRLDDIYGEFCMSLLFLLLVFAFQGIRLNSYSPRCFWCIHWWVCFLDLCACTWVVGLISVFVCLGMTFIAGFLTNLKHLGSLTLYFFGACLIRNLSGACVTSPHCIGSSGAQRVFTYCWWVLNCHAKYSSPCCSSSHGMFYRLCVSIRPSKVDLQTGRLPRVCILCIVICSSCSHLIFTWLCASIRSLKADLQTGHLSRACTLWYALIFYLSVIRVT